LERRWNAIKTATPLTLDEAAVVPHRLQALVYVEQLRVMLNAIKQFDAEIERVAKQHEDYALFTALPGAGPNLAPRLLVAFGEQRDRYKSAADLQKY
jgi:DNA uptake protein ComE-like DNA-binding protein